MGKHRTSNIEQPTSNVGATGRLLSIGCWMLPLIISHVSRLFPDPRPQTPDPKVVRCRDSQRAEVASAAGGVDDLGGVQSDFGDAALSHHRSARADDAPRPWPGDLLHLA